MIKGPRASLSHSPNGNSGFVWIRCEKPLVAKSNLSLHKSVGRYFTIIKISVQRKKATHLHMLEWEIDFLPSLTSLFSTIMAVSPLALSLVVISLAFNSFKWTVYYLIRKKVVSKNASLSPFFSAQARRHVLNIPSRENRLMTLRCVRWCYKPEEWRVNIFRRFSLH